MAKANWSIKAWSPLECDEEALETFREQVISGGEVSPWGLRNRIKKAEKLIFFYVDNNLAGIGALKRPDRTYRNRVADNSDFKLSETTYPFELGWVFVLEEHRGHGRSKRISKRALIEAHGAGMFATTHARNAAMRNVLEHTGFVAVGERFKSRQEDRLLQLFVRKSSRAQVH